MSKKITALLTVTTLSISLPAFAGAKIDAAAVMKERCGACHAVARVMEAKKSKSEWDKTVTRMIAKGAKLNSEEKSALVNHLAKNYK